MIKFTCMLVAVFFFQVNGASLKKTSGLFKNADDLMLTKFADEVNKGFRLIAGKLQKLAEETRLQKQRLDQLITDEQHREYLMNKRVFDLEKGMLSFNGTYTWLQSQGAVCPKNWKTHKTRCFYVGYCHDLSPDQCTATATKNICQKLGGTLASVLSMDDDTFIDNLFTGPAIRNVFLGGSDAVTEGRWLWGDGSAFKYENWYETEPNDCCGGQDCMIKWRDYAGKWDDANCTDKYKSSEAGYICEKSI